MLIAEMYYAHKVAPGVLLMINMPTNAGVRDLLGQIGYFKYFPKANWTRPDGSSRLYLEHRRGVGVDGEAVRALVNHLKADGALPVAAFYEALAEGMANAQEWGYANAQTGYRFWWLLGYRDSVSGEIAYCFYDQGQSIPRTIKARLRDRARLIAPRGSQLMRKAVVTGHYSRTGKPSRGRGLPTLKRFIDSGKAGELLIQSQECQCIFRTSERPILADFKVGLRGTLISWTFTA